MRLASRGKATAEARAEEETTRRGTLAPSLFLFCLLRAFESERGATLTVQELSEAVGASQGEVVVGLLALERQGYVVHEGGGVFRKGRANMGLTAWDKNDWLWLHTSDEPWAMRPLMSEEEQQAKEVSFLLLEGLQGVQGAQAIEEEARVQALRVSLGRKEFAREYVQKVPGDAHVAWVPQGERAALWLWPVEIARLVRARWREMLAQNLQMPHACQMCRGALRTGDVMYTKAWVGPSCAVVCALCHERLGKNTMEPGMCIRAEDAEGPLGALTRTRMRQTHERLIALLEAREEAKP